jgi:hypothetical protein
MRRPEPATERGIHKGDEVPSCGGSRRTGRAGGFGWRGTCRGVGGTRPPRLSPEGKRERGESDSLRRRLIPNFTPRSLEVP